MSRRFRALALLTLAGLLAVALTACGSSDSSPSAANDDPDAILKDTFGGATKFKSGKLDLDVAFDAKGLRGVKGPINLKLRGPFESLGPRKLPKLDVSLSFQAGGQSFSAGAISTGDRGFLTFQGTTYVVPDDVFASFKKGFERSQAKSGSAKNQSTPLSALGLSPRAWLSDPSIAGTERVGGVDTVHVTSKIDVGKLLEDLNRVIGTAGNLGAGKAAGLDAGQRAAIESAIKEASVDVWSGTKDHALRKLSLRVVFDVPPSLRAKAGGLESGNLRLDLLIDDLNQPQAIAAPKNAKPLSDLLGTLGSLGLGGALGGGSGSSGSSGSSSASPSPDLEAYSACLQKAGSDVAKAQDCAALLSR